MEVSITTECGSETGVTVGIIDSIITSLHLLKGRDIKSKEVRESISDLCSHPMVEELFIKSYEFGENFWKYPAKFVPINDVGHDRIQNLYGRFAIVYLLKNMPIFTRAYTYLREQNNFSEKEAFGEMHGDKYLWIEQHDHAEVLVLKEQSHSFIYIKNGASFYIRSLEFGKEAAAIKKYRLSGFKPGSGNADSFRYGDGRDKNHVLSAQLLLPDTSERVATSEFAEQMKELSSSITTDNANYHTIHAIEEIAQWEHYLNDPDELT